MLHSTLQLFSLLSSVIGEEKKTNDYLQLALVKTNINYFNINLWDKRFLIPNIFYRNIFQ